METNIKKCAECLWDTLFSTKAHSGLEDWQRLDAGVHTRDAYFPFSLLSHYLRVKEVNCLSCLPLFFLFRLWLLIRTIQDEPDKTRKPHSLIAQFPSRSIKQALICSPGELRGHKSSRAASEIKACWQQVNIWQSPSAHLTQGQVTYFLQRRTPVPSSVVWLHQFNSHVRR